MNTVQLWLDDDGPIQWIQAERAGPYWEYRAKNMPDNRWVYVLDEHDGSRPQWPHDRGDVCSICSLNARHSEAAHNVRVVDNIRMFSVRRLEQH